MGVFVTKGGMKSPGSGRVKGTRNKISQAFLEALAADFEEGGAAAIKVMRIERPSEYVNVLLRYCRKSSIFQTTDWQKFRMTNLNSSSSTPEDSLSAP